MRKYFVTRSFRGTCSSVKILKGYILSVEMLQGYMLICRNAEGVHGKKKVGNPSLNDVACSGANLSLCAAADSCAPTPADILGIHIPCFFGTGVNTFTCNSSCWVAQRLNRLRLVVKT